MFSHNMYDELEKAVITFGYEMSDISNVVLFNSEEKYNVSEFLKMAKKVTYVPKERNKTVKDFFIPEDLRVIFYDDCYLYRDTTISEDKILEFHECWCYANVKYNTYKTKSILKLSSKLLSENTINFYDETVEAIYGSKHTISDISWIGLKDEWKLNINDFFELAKRINYVYLNSEYSTKPVIPMNLIIAFYDNTFLSRIAISDLFSSVSYGWLFNQLVESPTFNLNIGDFEDRIEEALTSDSLQKGH